MAIRKVARLGHPVLRQAARAFESDEITSVETRQLVNDMLQTMEDYGGVGLAAPQVHESVQLAIIEVGEENERYFVEKGVPLVVVLNPKLSITDPTLSGFWEGCLSVPELRGYVERPAGIQVDFTDINGERQRLKADGFFATVLQHELDHLSGVLYTDKLKDPTQFAFLQEFGRYHNDDDQ